MTLNIGARKQTSENTGSSQVPRKFSWTGTIAALLFAATLTLAPAPAFAQHGGGGGGGGGSHGGGGGGGGHVGGGGGGSHPSGGGSAAHAAAGPSGGNAGTSANHWWNPFHGGSSNSAARGLGATGNNVNAQRFATGNNTWQDPPAEFSANRGRAVASTGTAGAHAAVSPPHVPIRPGRPGYGYGGYYPYYPYYGYPYGGFGFGFGGLWYGAYGPCDPFWGCYGYGYGYGDPGNGYGYFSGGSYSSGVGADLSYSGSDYAGAGDMSGSQEPDPPTLFAAAPETWQAQDSSAPAQKHVVAVLYLKNGSSYAVTDYWLTDGKIHYVTSYGGENSVEQKDLDLQRTVNENAAQGLTFTLRPVPGNGAEQAAPQGTGTPN